MPVTPSESAVVDPGGVFPSGLSNPDLQPTTEAQRTWNWWTYCALWIGMAHCVPTWLLAGALIDLGLSWWQVILLMAIGNCIVLVPIVLNGYAGTKYGIPFPVFARASFGVRGANIPALARGIVAAVWFGIQVHIGGGALKLLALQLFGGLSALEAHKFLDYSALDWGCYAIFLVFNLVVLMRGMETLKRFEQWAAPLILVFAIVVCVWACKAAGGLGPVMDASNHTPPDLASVMAKGLVSIVGFWSTLGLNSPDFSRFARTQRDQMVGQALGLPTTMVVFSVLGVLTSSAMAVIYGKVIWNPLDIIQKMPAGVFTALALVGILVATVCVNVPANLVSPAYDFSNLAPRYVSFWRGALITAALATAIMPWRILASAGTYIFDWLGTYGDLLGPIAGILIVDYWIVRRRSLNLVDLYRLNGEYRYAGGSNPIAIVALALGIGAALIGRYVPSLQAFSDFGWFTGLFVGGALYCVLMAVSAPPAASDVS